MYSPFAFRPTVASAIAQLCSRVAGTAVKKFAIEWLLTIPLYHFLENMSKPCGKVKFDGKPDWELYNTKLGMTNVADKIRKENR
jgi:hypothetical protein